MSRGLPILAAGCLLAVVALVAVVALLPSVEPSNAARSDALAGELRCPDCQGLSVADSPTSSASEIRRQIDGMLAAGATDDEVRDHFVDRYGNWIRLAPTSALVWILPFLVLIAGVGVLALWLHAQPAPHATRGTSVDPEQRRRLHEEVDSLDA